MSATTLPSRWSRQDIAQVLDLGNSRSGNLGRKETRRHHRARNVFQPVRNCKHPVADALVAGWISLDRHRLHYDDRLLQHGVRPLSSENSERHVDAAVLATGRVRRDADHDHRRVRCSRGRRPGKPLARSWRRLPSRFPASWKTGPSTVPWRRGYSFLASCRRNPCGLSKIKF